MANVMTTGTDSDVQANVQDELALTSDVDAAGIGSWAEKN
jgi:hypothetical protein